MAAVPGVVMLEPGSGRAVWVAVRDRADFEARGYVMGERDPVIEEPAEVAETAPAEAPAEDEPEEKPSGGVTFPRRVDRGRRA